MIMYPLNFYLLDIGNKLRHYWKNDTIFTHKKMPHWFQVEDLKLLMSHLEHWGHRLFPKMPFDDLIERLEKLGAKKEMQVCYVQWMYNAYGPTSNMYNECIMHMGQRLTLLLNLLLLLLFLCSAWLQSMQCRLSDQAIIINFTVA